MNNKTIILLLILSFSVFSQMSNAGALKKDCSPLKAGKNAAMKATVGVGGRCSPADAAKDSAKDAVGVDMNDNGRGKEKGKHKSEDKSKDKNNKLLKKVVK